MQLDELGPISVNKDTKYLLTPAIQGDLDILMRNCPEKGSHFVGWLAQYFQIYSLLRQFTRTKLSE